MGQSRTVIAVVVLLLSFILPAAICATVLGSPRDSITQLALVCLAATTWMAILALVNWWEFTSVWLRWAWLAALVATIARRLQLAASLPVAAPANGVDFACAVLLAGGIFVLLKALSARRHDGKSVEATFPLSDGRFLVTDGGDGARSFLVNYHYGFGGHRASGVSASMRYAIDVVEIGGAGCESRGFLPRDNQSYRIWRKTLHAPCDGVIVHTVNDVSDNHAFGSNRPYGVGNHVVIRGADDVHFVLGHMERCSICVKPGSTVSAGDAIGRVGNSGWTERPHLHMQAMRASSGDWWHGEAVPMRFAGRFPVRNGQMVMTRSGAQD